MLSDKDSSHSGQKDGQEEPVKAALPNVNMEASFYVGEPMLLSVSGLGKTVSLTGDVVQEAAKQPLVKEDLIRRLAKVGDSGFSAGDISVRMGENCFLPVGAINRVRREALVALRESILSDTRRVCESDTPLFAKDQAEDEASANEPGLCIQITKKEQLDPVLSESRPDLVLLDIGDYDAGLLAGADRKIGGLNRRLLGNGNVVLRHADGIGRQTQGQNHRQCEKQGQGSLDGFLHFKFLPFQEKWCTNSAL